MTIGPLLSRGFDRIFYHTFMCSHQVWANLTIDTCSHGCMRFLQPVNVFFFSLLRVLQCHWAFRRSFFNQPNFSTDTTRVFFFSFFFFNSSSKISERRLCLEMTKMLLYPNKSLLLQQSGRTLCILYRDFCCYFLELGCMHTGTIAAWISLIADVK